MSFSQLRVAAARETFNTNITPEEELMVAPPDEAMADPSVAAEIIEDEAQVNQLQSDVAQLSNDGVEVATIVSQLEGEEVSPVAASVAAERLSAIFNRYPELPGLTRMRAARESMQADGIDIDEAALPPSYTVDELIDESKQNLEYMKIAANEGLKEMANSVAVNVRDFFRFNTTYAKVAVKVKQQAQQTVGTPSDAKYTNAVRIAHFTTADKRVLSNARDLATSMGKLNKTIAAVAVVAERLSNIFDLFKNEDGLDLKGLFNGIVMVDGRISLSGDGLFGEEYCLTDISLREVANLHGLVEACKNIRVNNDNVWTVKELQSDGLMELPALSSKEIVANIDAAIQAANMIPIEANTAQRIMGAAYKASTNGEAGDINDLLADLAIQREFFLTANRITNVLRAMNSAVITVISNKTKALNCLLDYYEWSLGQHKSTSTESHDKNAAREGFAGGLLGFILGSVAWATVVGSSVAGFGAAQAAETLRKKIKATSTEIARMRNAEIDEQVKSGKFDKKMAESLKVDPEAIIYGALGGLFVAPIYGAIKGSQIQDRSAELKRLTEELEALYAEAEKKKASSSKSSEA